MSDYLDHHPEGRPPRRPAPRPPQPPAPPGPVILPDDDWRTLWRDIADRMEHHWRTFRALPMQNQRLLVIGAAVSLLIVGFTASFLAHTMVGGNKTTPLMMAGAATPSPVATQLPTPTVLPTSIPTPDPQPTAMPTRVTTVGTATPIPTVTITLTWQCKALTLIAATHPPSQPCAMRQGFIIYHTNGPGNPIDLCVVQGSYTWSSYVSKTLPCTMNAPKYSCWNLVGITYKQSNGQTALTSTKQNISCGGG